MYFFKNDYSEGAHPKVLDALQRTNLTKTVGYGLDPFCAQAAETLKKRFACPDADVHFLVGGTQTNFTSIAAFLRPWEAVVAASTAHIASHETGAVEATGHKILTMDTPDGKLTPSQVRQAVAAHREGNEEHMVLPRLVYISLPTELGTVYSRSELEALSAVCRELGLFLYIDGARLACALTSRRCDIRPEDLAKYSDAFYLGGTKNALLFGEALMIVRDELKPYFRNSIKQHGGMLAKGRLLGVQFQAILENDLFLDVAAHANRMAEKLTDGIRAAGYTFYVDSSTNQVFPIFSKARVAELKRDFVFEDWAAAGDGLRAIRLVTSWATEQEAVDAFLKAIRK